MGRSTVGSVLRGWREARGYSVHALSKATGITRRTIDRIEADETAKLDTFARLARALRIDDASILALVELAAGDAPALDDAAGPPETESERRQRAALDAIETRHRSATG